MTRKRWKPKEPREMPDDDAYLDTPQLTQVVPSGQSTWEKRRVDGSGPPFVKCGGRVLYRWGDVKTWLEARKRRSTSDVGKAA
jgi:hypothetical protein